MKKAIKTIIRKYNEVQPFYHICFFWPILIICSNIVLLEAGVINRESVWGTGWVVGLEAGVPVLALMVFEYIKQAKR